MNRPKSHEDSYIAPASQRPRVLTKLLEQRHAASPELTPLEASELFWKKGFLGVDQKVPDGFSDPGAEMKVYKLESGEKEFVYEAEREVILCDALLDLKLSDHIAKSRAAIRGALGEKQKALALGKYVIGALGGAQIDANVLAYRTAAEIKKLREKKGKRVILLGELLHGVCRHRSLLFKYLADRDGVKAELVRGFFQYGKHSWNTVEVEGKKYLLDTMLGIARGGELELQELDNIHVARVYKRLLALP